MTARERPGPDVEVVLPFDDHLEALSTRECLGYLAAGGLGRVGLVVAGVPVVLPVCFVLDGDDVVFLTGSGSKLRAALAEQVVAFEVDHLDDSGTGWSVLVIGEATASDDEADVGRARQLGLEPVAPGPHDHAVRVHRRHVSGRRFGWRERPALLPNEP